MTAIILPCSGSKAWQPIRQLTAASLPVADQNDLSAEWVDRLRTLGSSVMRGPARELYTGRGFGFGRRAHELAGGTMFVVSAGLGFVPGLQHVPSYGLTVSGDGPEAIHRAVPGRFDPRAWWDDVCQGPFSQDPVAILNASRGPILMALSHPYALLLAGTLAALEEETIDRLRIWGRGLDKLLAPHVRRAVQPHPNPAELARFQPGTPRDWHQRALLFHVARNAALAA